MNDYQSYRPPDAEDERGELARRQRMLVLLLGCLGLVAMVAAVVGLALFVVSRGRDDMVDAGQVFQPATVAEQAPEQAAGSLTAALPSPSPDLPQQDETETPEPTASPTVEPTATATPQPTATERRPTATPTEEVVAPGRIAVVDDLDRLWTMAADGSDRRLLTDDGRTYQFPSWSPAGNEIAVIGSDFGGGGVYVVADDDGSEMRQLYADAEDRPIYLYWAPEGEYVSFIASHPDGLALQLAPRNGSGASEIVTTSPSTFFWTWVPDGSQVLVHTGFTARQSDDSRLAFVPLDRGAEAQEIVQRGFFQAPAVAADGHFFSYGDVDPTGKRWLSVRDVVRDQQVKLIFHQGVVAMGFSPTAPQLAYISPEVQEDSFYGPLRLVDLESGDTRQLVAETVLAYFWSPDGRSIAYLTLETGARPFDFDGAPTAQLDPDLLAGRIEQAPGAAKKVALAKERSQGGEQARISLGLSVVDVESGETTLLTIFEPSTVFMNQFLPFFDQYALSHRIWSPDSSALILPMEDSQDRDFIVVVPVDGGDPLPIATGVAAFWSQQ